MAPTRIRSGQTHSHKHTGSVFSSLWDKLGIIASGLCLIDCIVLPIVSTLLMSFQSTAAWAEGLHWVLLPIIGMTAGMAFYHSYKAHRSYLIVASGTLGFTLLIVGEIFEANLKSFTFNWVSVVGSVFLIGAHIRNLVMHLGHGDSTVCTVDHAPHALFGHGGNRAVQQGEIGDHTHAAQVP